MTINHSCNLHPPFFSSHSRRVLLHTSFHLLLLVYVPSSIDLSCRCFGFLYIFRLFGLSLFLSLLSLCWLLGSLRSVFTFTSTSFGGSSNSSSLLINLFNSLSIKPFSFLDHIFLRLATILSDSLPSLSSARRKFEKGFH